MKPFEKFFREERFEMNWRRLLLQGVVIMLVGITLTVICAAKPKVIILFAKELSWLPVSGMVILALGLVECLDALLAKETRDFLQNLQVGVLDVVVGGLIFLSVADAPARFGMMVATFLLVRGIIRITLVYALGLPKPELTAIGGAVSIIMGIMIWFGWPSAGGWFLSLCLNIEIAIRGWSVIVFAWWVKNQTTNSLY